MESLHALVPVREHSKGPFLNNDRFLVSSPSLPVCRDSVHAVRLGLSVVGALWFVRLASVCLVVHV